MAEGVLAEIVRRKRSDVHDRLRGGALDPQPTRRSLCDALARPGARFIMEVKRSSPSGHRSDVDVAEAVAAYAPVADAISVLTDEPYFSGSLDDLRVARSLFDGPILAKDFIVDPRQVGEARTYGADAVLVILAVLDDGEAGEVLAEARRLGMDAVVEAHDEIEIRRALTLGAAIIGINNRDLKTLKTDLSVTERLAGLVPEHVTLVSESGIRTRTDVERLSARVDAFLVGSSLMASHDIALAARSLVHGPVKICGLTSVEDVMAAGNAGATHAGLIFADDSVRKVGVDAPMLAEEARARGMKAVGVFRGQDHGAVASIADSCGLDAVQLHGAGSPLDDLRKTLPDSCEIWVACDVRDSAQRAHHGADRTLFDSSVGGRSGGTGQAFDWSLIAGRPDLRTAFIAGGIGAANARLAQQVGAFGIDVGSGIESGPGKKDPGKLNALFNALRLPCRRAVKCG